MGCMNLKNGIDLNNKKTDAVLRNVLHDDIRHLTTKEQHNGVKKTYCPNCIVALIYVHSV